MSKYKLTDEQVARYRAMRMLTADEERMACMGPMGPREHCGAIVDGDNLIYIDGDGNPLEPGWVLRVLRGTDARPMHPLEAKDHPWMRDRRERLAGKP